MQIYSEEANLNGHYGSQVKQELITFAVIDLYVLFNHSEEIC